MLYEVEWAEDGTYVPGEEFSPERFFNDGLKNSTEFDLKLGYFSSAAISVLAEGFATFISQGGYMRLIINHIVSKKDKEAINDGVMGNVIDCADLSNFQYLKSTFDEYQEQFFRCLAYMISQKRIDIRIIKPRGQKGIAHTKTGQFRDGDSITAFTGSANFTISGLFNNIENISIDRSDSVDVMVQKRIAKQRKDFDAIMSGEKKGIEYLSPKDLVEALSTNYGDSDIEELLDVEEKLKEHKRGKNVDDSQKPWKAAEDFTESEPHFPYPTGPREYQKKAFDSWKKSQCGLFNMATGTGKTLTSLNCLLQIYNQFGYYKAIILVPTVTLVEQWEKECRKFDFQHIVKVCSKNKDWKGEIDRLTMKENFNPTNSPINYVVISTYASFARDNVFHDLMSLSKKCLLIADEAHNMGSKRILDRIESVGKRFKRRLGLSATPERQFDEKGNKELRRFFNSENEYTFVYSMEEAIKNRFLCEYYYFPHVVRLCDEEMYDYKNISQKLGKIYRYNGGYLDLEDEIVRNLLLKRRRIIHKARNKKDAFKNIIEQRYEEKGNLKYTLVYVPEGLKPDSIADVYDSSDVVEDDAEADKLIDEFTQIVMNVSTTTTVRKFVSGQKNRDTILEDFANGDLEVLTSMKCLDEGVDVPRSEMAIFCASTGNPRQFIQRRGRILRTHKDKKYAYIHDLVVVPDIGADCVDYEMERKLILSELKRVRDFASLSRNLDYSYTVLEEVLKFYNIPLLD
ncbi:MAG: DEAD/DEAH box helicase family protein [Prevotella sp.]|nr:DEAD/DEAH box helicase family protein [Prevotella sp.]